MPDTLTTVMIVVICLSIITMVVAFRQKQNRQRTVTQPAVVDADQQIWESINRLAVYTAQKMYDVGAPGLRSSPKHSSSYDEWGRKLSVIVGGTNHPGAWWADYPSLHSALLQPDGKWTYAGTCFYSKPGQSDHDAERVLWSIGSEGFTPSKVGYRNQFESLDPYSATVQHAKGAITAIARELLGKYNPDALEEFNKLI